MERTSYCKWRCKHAAIVPMIMLQISTKTHRQLWRDKSLCKRPLQLLLAVGCDCNRTGTENVGPCKCCNLGAAPSLSFWHQLACAMLLYDFCQRDTIDTHSFRQSRGLLVLYAAARLVRSRIRVTTSELFFIVFFGKFAGHLSWTLGPKQHSCIRIQSCPSESCSAVPFSFGMRCFAPGKLACVVSVLQVARAVDGIAHTQSNSFAASVADSNAAVTDFQLTVDVSNAWRNVSSNLYAAFIEDINHSVTGGLLAELLNDVQCNGPFVGQGDVPGTTRVSLMSNWTALDQGPFYLRFVGGYVLTRDGSGDATFSMMSPGLTGEPGSMSFITIYGPNTDCVGGYYLAANNMSSSGQLMQAKLDGSKSTNESATFLMSPGVNGSGVVLTSRSPAFPGWLLTVGNYKTGGWVGDQYTVSLVDPASVSPSPGPAQQWYIAPPKQPAQEAWQLTHGVGSTVSGSFDDSMPPLNPNSTTALKLTFNTSTGMNTTLPGVCNVGYLGGFGVSPGDVFNLSFWMLTYDVPNGTCTDASLNATLDGPVPGWMTPSIEAVDGSAEFTTFQFIPVALAPGVWTRYSATLIAQKAPQPNSTANFCLRSAVNGTVWLDAPSLTPAVTFMNRTNGMRNDLATMVADMRPAALRFPGGCFVEGINHTTAWNFSTTVGPIETRPGHFNMWQYWSNDRAGMYEYLQWAEDMNAMPIWVLNAGTWERVIASSRSSRPMIGLVSALSGDGLTASSIASRESACIRFVPSSTRTSLTNCLNLLHCTTIGASCRFVLRRRF